MEHIMKIISTHKNKNVNNTSMMSFMMCEVVHHTFTSSSKTTRHIDKTNKNIESNWEKKDKTFSHHDEHT